MRHSSAIASLFLILGLVACDEDVAGPGEGAGVLRAAAIGDGDETTAAAQQLGGTRFSQLVYNQQGEVEGEVSFSAKVFVQTSAGEWVQLTEQLAQEVTVDASGEGEAEVFVREEVEATAYTRARVVFEEVEANVTGGLKIGIGGILTGVIRVSLGGDEEVVVEQPINLRVNAGSEGTLVVNLNADAWLSRADAEARTVDEADFRSAVRLFATS